MQYTQKNVVLYGCIIILSSFPIASFAHGGGLTIQQDSEEYRITLDAVSLELHAGTAERINFELERKGDGASVEFTHVWLRIMDPDENFVFSGNIQSAPKGFVTGISYFFPQPGTHAFAVRFFDGERLIAETEIPVSVSGTKTNKEPFAMWLILALSFIGGSFVGFLLRRMK